MEAAGTGAAFAVCVKLNDCEFVHEVPPEPSDELPAELTGWEAIVFELMDDEDDDEE